MDKNMNKNRKVDNSEGKYIEKARKSYPLLEEKPVMSKRGVLSNIFYAKNSQPDYIHMDNEIDPAMDLAREYAVNIMMTDVRPEWRKEARITGMRKNSDVP